MRFVTSFWMVDRRPSTLSIFVDISPVSPRLSVTVASCSMRRSRSFSCSFRTFTMKSMASRASSLLGFLDMSLSSLVTV